MLMAICNGIQGVTKKRAIAPVHAPDLSFGHWVPSMDDDDDTASSSSADSKAAQLAEESLMVRAGSVASGINCEFAHISYYMRRLHGQVYDLMFRATY